MALPEGDEGDGPLEFAGGLTDEERFVSAGQEVEVGGEQGLQPG